MRNERGSVYARLGGVLNGLGGWGAGNGHAQSWRTGEAEKKNSRHEAGEDLASLGKDNETKPIRLK